MQVVEVVSKEDVGRDLYVYIATQPYDPPTCMERRKTG